MESWHYEFMFNTKQEAIANLKMLPPEVATYAEWIIKNLDEPNGDHYLRVVMDGRDGRTKADIGVYPVGTSPVFDPFRD